jgi:phosphoribosylaminoimidazolecarboxamide formyltransferase/IMP cyclohydrolase
MSKSNRRALISVSDKTGLESLGKRLSALGIEILSTGGTAKYLRDRNVSVTDVSKVTGFPEIMDGRVKTLHPKIHGALLGRRDLPEHQKAMETHGIEPIDFVFVNLYPFSETIRKIGVTTEEAIEQIDIGGPSMIRSSAKNHAFVVVVTDPEDYDGILAALERGEGITSERRRALALKAFRMTSDYDRMISDYFKSLEEPREVFPSRLEIVLSREQTLRYGENPHQKAALYSYNGKASGGIAGARKIWGKEMSYNNFLDVDAAFGLVAEFKEPAVVIVKHNNPCGVSLGLNVKEAYQKARDTDPVSSFGGVVAVNRQVDCALAEEMAKIFLEVVAAPEFSSEAKEILTKKKDIRLLEVSIPTPSNEAVPEIRTISGGVLVQSPDQVVTDPASELRFEGASVPTENQIRDALFAFAVAKHVKSNAIVLTKDGTTVGIGAGQMSRVDSVRLAGMKATRDTKGSILASDAFFPFRDGIDEAARLGVAGIIQPGGSIRDSEVFEAVREHLMFMILTGMRHFRH